MAPEVFEHVLFLLEQVWKYHADSVQCGQYDDGGDNEAADTVLRRSVGIPSHRFFII